jgi:hypothetical protein
MRVGKLVRLFIREPVQVYFHYNNSSKLALWLITMRLAFVPLGQFELLINVTCLNIYAYSSALDIALMII